VNGAEKREGGERDRQTKQANKTFDIEGHPGAAFLSFLLHTNMNTGASLLTIPHL
jgi:hypothetical protein